MNVRALKTRGPSPITSVPMRDEFIRGYIGRITALEMTGSEVKTLNYLKRPVAGEADAPGSSRSIWNALSRYSGITVQQLVASHTLIDFASPALRPYPGPSDQNEDRLIHSLNRLGLESGAGRYKKFCTECRDEQIQAHGFSYWIRQHQMPGRVFCAQHSAVLLCYEADDGYLKLPSHIRPTQRIGLDGLNDEATKDLITRYELAADMIGRSRRPFEVAKLKAVLRELARRSGLSPGSNKGVKMGDLQTPEQAYSTAFPLWWRQDFEGYKSSDIKHTGSSDLTGVMNTMTPSGPAVAAYLSLVTKDPIPEDLDLFSFIELHDGLIKKRHSLWSDDRVPELKSNFSTSWDLSGAIE